MANNVYNIEACLPIINQINIAGIYFDKDSCCYVVMHVGPPGFAELEESKYSYSKDSKYESCGISSASRKLIDQVLSWNNRLRLPALHWAIMLGHSSLLLDENDEPPGSDNELANVISVMEADTRELAAESEKKLKATPEWQAMVVRLKTAISKLKSSTKDLRRNKRRECASNEFKELAKKTITKYRLPESEILGLMTDVITELQAGK